MRQAKLTEVLACYRNTVPMAGQMVRVTEAGGAGWRV